jgi:cell division GTPase FtsZ
MDTDSHRSRKLGVTDGRGYGHTGDAEQGEMSEEEHARAISEFLAKSDAVRAMFGDHVSTDSTDMIREDRDRGWGRQ